MISKKTLRSFVACFSLLVPGLPSVADVDSRPNVLWIIAEDMSPDLGCYGNVAVHTPNIDQLAGKGMKFDRVFTTGPACSPSRTALATGVYQTTLGAHHMRYSEEIMPVLPEPYRTLPELMRELGYFTGNIRDVCGTGKGKDDLLFKTNRKIWGTRSWSELIQNQPFYGQINFSESHRPFARTAQATVDQAKVKIPPYYPDHPVARKDWAGYLEDVNRADERVGDILRQLERDGLAERTIVCFFSDHGRPMMRGKNWLYDSGTHIPLVIYYPEPVEPPEGYQAGGVNSDLISAVDLVAETVLMGGGAIPDWMQGRSFLQKDAKPREYIFTAVDRIGNINSRSRAVRSDRFKYIDNSKRPGSVLECSTAYRRAMHPIYHLLKVMSKKGLLTPAQAQLLQPIEAEELYDLENDPYETVNLIGHEEYVAVHQELKGELSEWIKSSGDKGFHEDSPAVVDYFTNYGRTTTKELTKFGATNAQKLQDTYERTRAEVEAHFE